MKGEAYVYGEGQRSPHVHYDVIPATSGALDSGALKIATAESTTIYAPGYWSRVDFLLTGDN